MPYSNIYGRLCGAGNIDSKHKNPKLPEPLNAARAITHCWHRQLTPSHAKKPEKSSIRQLPPPLLHVSSIGRPPPKISTPPPIFAPYL